jgi:hypothetical protein
MCGIEFSDKVPKIKEHNYFNAVFRGAACFSCNCKEGKRSKIIPAVFS